MSAQLSRTSLTGFDLLALFESKWRGAQPGTKVENNGDAISAGLRLCKPTRYA
jgi:hypothetical protein